jgi:hypothetical protein
MREKEGRLLPDFGEKFVEIVGCGRALSGRNALGGGNVLQETVVTVVDQQAPRKWR